MDFSVFDFASFEPKIERIQELLAAIPPSPKGLGLRCLADIDTTVAPEVEAFQQYLEGLTDPELKVLRALYWVGYDVHSLQAPRNVRQAMQEYVDRNFHRQGEIGYLSGKRRILAKCLKEGLIRLQK